MVLSEIRAKTWQTATQSTPRVGRPRHQSGMHPACIGLCADSDPTERRILEAGLSFVPSRVNPNRRWSPNLFVQCRESLLGIRWGGYRLGETQVGRGI